MTDLLSLSIWLENHSALNRLRQFERLLRLFPFSQREQPQSVVSIRAVSTAEPPLLEKPLNGPVNPAEILPIFTEYSGEDVAFEVETWWDLWQYVEDWKLAPARVLLSCFGSEFDNGTERPVTRQEDLRVDFGIDSNYLPRTELSGSARLVESNIKSLLRLVHELDRELRIEKRLLETESGENFSDRLQQVLTAGPIQ